MSTHTTGPKVERIARLRWVRLGAMCVSTAAQRQLNQSRVDRLTASFDPELMGNPTVSERGGRFYIVDGQHRIAALKAWLGGSWAAQQIQCWTYTGMTEPQEADLFDRLNDALRVDSFDTFRVRVRAGRAVESDIDRLVRAQGLSVSKQKVPGAVRAVGTLCRVYARSDADTLSRALRIIRDAYGDPGLESPVIDGIGHLCQRYNGQVDEETAIKQLSSAHGGVNGLLGLAEQLRKQTAASKAHCVAAAAVEIINRGRGGKKLPGWWQAS